MQRMLVVIFGTWVLSLIALSGCEETCTLMDCQDSVVVWVVQEDDEPTAAGNYVIEITSDLGDELVYDIKHDGQSRIKLNLAGSNIMESEDEPIFPEQIHFVVTSNKVILAQQTLHFEYQEYWCNGEGCDERETYESEPQTLIIESP